MGVMTAAQYEASRKAPVQEKVPEVETPRAPEPKLETDRIAETRYWHPDMDASLNGPYLMCIEDIDVEVKIERGTVTTTSGHEARALEARGFIKQGV